MAQTSGPLDLSQYISGVTNQAYTDWGQQQKQMDWAKDQFAKNSATADDVSKRALDTSGQFTGYSTADRALYDQTYVPAMKQQMDFARQYTTPERMAANRAAAGATSNIAMQAQRDASERALTTTGVDPSAGRFAGLDAGLAAKAAATSAGAMTKSDRDTEALGQQYLANAIQTGSVLPGQSVNEAGIGISAGNQAVNAPLAATASGAATMGTGLQWNAAGNDMFKQWMPAAVSQTNAGLTQNAQDLERQKFEASQSSGTGALIGAGLGILGTVAGGAMGGPMGAMVGGSLGGSLGKATAGTSGGGGFMSGINAAEGGMMHKNYAEGGSVEEEDMTDQYNTPLDDEEERRYHDWAAQNHREGDSFDYDMRGAWKQGERGDPQTGHFPDTYKKPNHPTFSDQSRYHGAGGRMGGRWDYDETGSETLQPHDPRYHAEGGRIAAYDAPYEGLHNAPYDVEDERLREDTSKAGEKLLLDRPVDPRSERGGKGWGNLPFDDGRRPGDASEFRFADGGRVAMISAFANGGDVMDDETMEGAQPPEEEMGEGENPNMVPPEASPSGGQNVDDVHAMVSEGEFVMPKDVTAWYGEKFMQNLINKARKESAGPKAEGQPGPPAQAMALAPPSFHSEGARMGA